MKIIETPDSKELRSLLSLIGREWEEEKTLQISLSVDEIIAMQKTILILEQASLLMAKIHPDIEPHEDVFFRAETELKEILAED